jgi:serine/threonine-protein kinase
MFCAMLQDSATWRARRGEGEGAQTRIPPVAVCGWTIERALGVGALCESWLATRDGTLAVLRVLRPRFAADDAMRAEWIRGSWSANRFHHGRVVRVIEQSADERGTPVLVRGWVKGESLERVVQRGPLDVARALRVAEQVLDALEMAHAHGILHAGLSPSNVILTPQGSVRITDFGHRGEDVLAAARVGAFSAPERRAAPGASPSEESDVWSVAACLRFALASRPLNADVMAVIDRAMAPDPCDRYESAYAMLGDVRRLLAGRQPKLRGALAPVPSQSFARPPLGEDNRPPPSSSGLRGLRGTAPPATPPPAGEWRGNALLVMAIAVLVGLATFVLVRERMADAPRSPPAASHTR